jgi:hypothetical protein
LGKDFRSSPWKKPSIDVAKAHRAQNTYESGAASFCSTGPKALGGLGEGISLYFYILRYLTVFFLLASILATPHMLISYNGGALEANDRDPAGLIQFTSINHADVRDIYDEAEDDVQMCESAFVGMDSLSCDELREFVLSVGIGMESEGGGLVLKPEQLVNPFIPSLSLAQLDCDLGCNCGWDLSDDGATESTTCSDYFEEVGRAWKNGGGMCRHDEGACYLPNACPIHASRTVASRTVGEAEEHRCGDLALKYGQFRLKNGARFFDETTGAEALPDCCVTGVQCGTYQPSK